MKKILNPNKLIREDVKCPTLEDLTKAKELICSILSDRSYQIKEFLKSNKLTNYGEFNSVSCNSVFENLNAIVRLGSNYLNQIFTLSRNFYELIIDNFWLYYFYKSNPNVAEDIAERFFMFQKKTNIQNLNDTISILNVDIFFRNLCKKDLVSKIEKHERYIEDYQYWGVKSQKKIWRAHPDYFKNVNEVKWKKRSEIAKKVSNELVNFKNAPFLENLNSLSAYNHWDPIQGNFLSATDTNLFYTRTLNLLLCLSLDFLNLQYQIQEIESKRPLIFGKAANLIFYSSI